MVQGVGNEESQHMTEVAQNVPGFLTASERKALSDPVAGIPPRLMTAKMPQDKEVVASPSGEQPSEVDFANGLHHLAKGTSCPSILS